MTCDCGFHTDDQDLLEQHMIALHPEESIDRMVTAVLKEAAEIAELNKMWNRR